MRLWTIFLSVLLLCAFTVAQERYLVSPNQEVIPISKSESAVQKIDKLRHPAPMKVADCTDHFIFGYTQDVYPTDSRFGIRHHDVLGQWFDGKATGDIDTIFWVSNGSVGTPESTVYIRIHRSLIGPDFGPGIRPGPWNAPCQSWGYWVNSDDIDQGVAAFIDDATDTTWHSTIAAPQQATRPPFSTAIWGFTGIPWIMHGGEVNNIPLEPNGGLLHVNIGDKFFVSFRDNHPPGHFEDDAARTEFAAWGSDNAVSTTNQDWPARDWKFYEHDSGPSNCAGIPFVQIKRGWVARGPLTDDTSYTAAYNIWYSMKVSSNVPPTISSIDNGDPVTTFDQTGPYVISADINDCNPAAPESAGVATAVIQWSKGTYDANGITFTAQPDRPMTLAFGTVWQGNIPGQPNGTIMSYQIKATDINGASSLGPVHSFRVVSLDNAYYYVDTTVGNSHKDIRATGNTIDTSRFFEPHYSGSGTAPKDDGTAGPFDIGGKMVFFGDSLRYAWIGVNGALALSKNANDTIDVNANGFATDSWTFPMRQHHYRVDTNLVSNPPPNFIAPYWADMIISDTVPRSSPGLGRIVYQAGYNSDPCQFIVEWDSVGAFGTAGNEPDAQTFRVVLNRCDGTIEFQYDNVGTHGLDSAALVGLQADSTALSGSHPGFVFVNKDIHPYVTKPRENWAIRFYPGAPYFATDGWNLISVATDRADHNHAKTLLYPSATSNAFAYHGTYSTTPTIPNGQGVWLKFTGSNYAGAPGLPVTSTVANVANGWNIIGSVSKPVSKDSVQQSTGGLLATGIYFQYTPGGYQSVSTLNPGRGFWVKATATGTLTLNVPSGNAPGNALAKQGEDIYQGMPFSVRVSDQAAHAQMLYLAGNEALKANGTMLLAELPPQAPEFDARYTSGRMVESYVVAPAVSQPVTVDYPVSITTTNYPVTFSWTTPKSLASGMTVQLVTTKSHKLLANLSDKATGTFTLKNALNEGVSIRLTNNPGQALPKTFALGQNYPNPFNPETHLVFDLPKTVSDLDVTVYDILGQKVATLVQSGDLQEAGSHELTWRALDSRNFQVPSGIYFIRMSVPSERFTQTQKVVLMK